MSEPSRPQDHRKQGPWRKGAKVAACALFDPPIQTRLFFRGIFLLLFVMTALRLIFLLVNREAFSGIGAAKLSLSFLNGLRFDLHMLLILFGLFFLPLHIPGRWKDRFPWVRHILWIPLVLFLPEVGLILLDVHYYADAGRHLSYEIFTVHSDRYDILSTAGMASKYGWTILFFATLSAFLLFGWKKILGKAPGGTKPAGISPARETFWMVFFLVFLLLGLRGGTIKGRPLRMSDAFTQGRTELGHLALNPLFTVLQSVLEGGRKVLSFLPGDKAVEKMRRLLGTSQTVWYGDETPLYRKRAVADGPARKHYNVVFLTMESWSPRYLGAYGDDQGTTPEFDKLAADGLLFENFYAVGNRTIEGLGAINLGIPGFNRSKGPTAGSFLSGSLEQNNYRGIGHILADAGYTSVYMHGESSSNFRHASLPTLAGFDKHLGRDELELTPEDTSGPWGGWDHALLDRLYDIARSEPEPFFTLWMSLTNHSPFTLPDDTFKKAAPGDAEGEFRDSIRYTDHYLGRFIERMRREDRFDRTIFVITADHSARNTATMEDRYHIPLLLYAPGIIEPGRDKRVGSQLDIIPTLVDLLGLEGYHHAMGISLLDNEKERFAFLNFAQGYGWITGREILEVDPDGRPLGIRNMDTGDKVTAGILPRTQNLLSFVQVGRSLLIENRLAPAPWKR